jgi:poly(3-hydroxybutyrate) depolymerase
MVTSALRLCVLTGCASVLAGLTPTARAASALGAYNVDPNTVTVAGISSGGFIAVQLQVAYFKSITGTAIFVGGPYDCAQGNSNTVQTTCESGSGVPLQTNTQASNGTIDPTSNIAK